MKAKIKVPKNTRIVKNHNFYDLGDCFGDVVPVELNNKKFKVLDADELNTYKIDIGDREIWIHLKAFSKNSQKKLIEHFGEWKEFKLNNESHYVNLKTMDYKSENSVVNLNELINIVNNYKKKRLIKDEAWKMMEDYFNRTKKTTP